MSKTTWVVVVVVVVAALGAWWWYSSQTPAPSQSAAALNGTPSADSNLSDMALGKAVAAIDSHLGSIKSALAVTPATAAGLLGAAKEMQTTAALMVSLANNIQSRAVNAKTAGGSTAGVSKALNDMAIQLSNMGSQAQVVIKNLSATSTVPNLGQAAASLKTAQAGLTTGRADLGAALQVLGVK
jgi:hypothetical protein